MQVIRGDDYQSWVYSNEEDLVVVDPWLTKKQVFPKYHWLLSRESTRHAYLIKHNLVKKVTHIIITAHFSDCLLYTSPSPRDATLSRMPSSA